MKKTSIWASLASILVLAFPVTTIAQDADAAADEAPAPLSDVWMIVPKSGMDAEFTAAMATHMQFRKDAGETRDWQAYRVAVGHKMKPIQMRSCCFDWADFDAYEAEDAELGLSANFRENVGQYVDHYHHYIERSDWEHSHWPETGTSGPYYGVTSWTAKQEGLAASGDARRKMSKLGKEEGFASEDNNWLWLFREAGGPAITMVASSFDSYADMEPPEQSFYEFIVEQLGEVDAAELFDDFNAAYKSSDYTIWVWDEAISTPAGEEDGDAAE